MVGGTSWMLPASRRASISAGCTHSSSWISPLSMVTSPASPTGARPTKNQVENRLVAFIETSGGVQWLNGTSAVGLHQQVGLLQGLAGRGAPGRGLVVVGVGGGVVLGVDLSAGEHPHATEGDLRVLPQHEHLERGASTVTRRRVAG